MEHHKGEAAGLAGFAGDLLWDVAQVGQAMLDAATVLLLALLVYHHGAAMKHAVPVPIPQGAEERALGCDSPLVPADTCILAMPLLPAAT